LILNYKYLFLITDNQLSRVRDLPLHKKKELEKNLALPKPNGDTWKQLARELGKTLVIEFHQFLLSRLSYESLGLWECLTHQLPVVRKDMDVNEHERLSNITCRHKLKLKKRNSTLKQILVIQNQVLITNILLIVYINTVFWAIMVVIVSVKSVPITTKSVSSNPVHGEVYSIQHYVI
jgi:hypothetical protein